LQVEVALALAHEQAKLLDYMAGSCRSLPPNHEFIVLKELLANCDEKVKGNESNVREFPSFCRLL
jgi:hypothetical protein